MNEELLKYYEYLKGQKADVPGTLESFQSTLQDDVSARKYYDYLRENDFDTPDSFESFQQTFGLKKKVVSGYPGPMEPENFGTVSPDPSQLASTDSNEIAISAPPIKEPDLNFGTATIEDIEGQLRAEMQAEPSVPGMALPEQQVPMAFDRPGVQMLPGQQQLAENRLEGKKEHLKELIGKADRAQAAEEFKKISGNMIGRIDEELAKTPPDVEFGKSGWGVMGGGERREATPREVLVMAKDLLQGVQESGDREGFLEGVSSKGLTGVLPFISSMEETPALRKIQEASQKETPTSQEKTLLTAEAIRREYEAAKDSGDWYRAGRAFAEMIPYMGEFALTGGVYSTGRALATKGLTTLLRGAATKPAVVKGVIKPISTLIGVAAQTSANPSRIVNTALERMTPQMQLALDQDTNELKAKMGLSGEGFEEAFTKAFGVNALEILTERFGQWGNEALQAMKGSKNWLPQVVLGRWMEKRGLVNLEEAAKAARKIGYDGIIQEIWFEEYPNKLLQELVTGDQKILDELMQKGTKDGAPMSKKLVDFFNPLSQEFIDMIPAVVLMGGAPTLAGAAQRFLTKEKQVVPPQGDLGKVEPLAKGDLTKLEEFAKKHEAPVDPKVEAKPIPKDLKERGEPIQNHADALSRLGEERIFAFSEQDGKPTEITTLKQLESYTLDQLLAYPSKPKPAEPVKKEKAPDEVVVYHGGQLDEGISEEGFFYVSTEKSQSEQYAKEHQGKLHSFTVDKSKIASEEEARKIINELGLKSKDPDWPNLDELQFHEIFDGARFGTSLSDEDISTVKDELIKRGYTGVSFTDADITLRNKIGVENYVLFSPKDAKPHGKPKAVLPRDIDLEAEESEAKTKPTEEVQDAPKQTWLNDPYVDKLRGRKPQETPEEKVADVEKEVDTERIYYRGTEAPEDHPKAGGGNEHFTWGVSTSTSKDYAKFHGENVKQYYAKKGKFIDYLELADKYEEEKGTDEYTEKQLSEYGKKLGFIGTTLDDPQAGGRDYRFFDAGSLVEVPAKQEKTKLSDITKTEFGKEHIIVAKPGGMETKPATKTDWLLTQRVPAEMKGKTVSVRVIRNGVEGKQDMDAEQVVNDIRTRAGIKKAEGKKSPMEQLIDCFGK